jgi:NAD-dependent DNA ligase
MAMNIKELIRRRRAQILVHSCIYYEMDDNLVSDDQWQAWAEELNHLQNQFPDHCNVGYFDWEFRDWDGTTGAHLPFRHPKIMAIARSLLENNKIVA